MGLLEGGSARDGLDARSRPMSSADNEISPPEGSSEEPHDVESKKEAEGEDFQL